MSILIWLSIISAFGLTADRSDGCSSGRSTGIGCITTPRPDKARVEVTTTKRLSFVKRQKGGYCLYDGPERHCTRTSQFGQVGFKVSHELIPMPTKAVTIKYLDFTDLHCSIAKRVKRGWVAATSKPIAAKDLFNELSESKLENDTALAVLYGSNAIRTTRTKTCRKPLKVPYLNYTEIKLGQCGIWLTDTDPDSRAIGKVVDTIERLADSSDSQFTCAKRARI